MASNSSYRELSDKQRIDTVLDEISAKSGIKANETKLGIESAACELLMRYVDETVSAILKESSLLASHRQSNILEVDDLQLILLKKFGIEVPGSLRGKLLHKQVCDSNLNAATSRSILTKTNTAVVSEADLTAMKPAEDTARGVETETTETHEMHPARKRSRNA